MNVKLHTGDLKIPDYRTITSAAAAQKTAAGREAGDFDKVSLNRPAETEDDADFARILARKEAKRLEAGVSDERVLILKRQVESGAYHPDARRIAERILGYR